MEMTLFCVVSISLHCLDKSLPCFYVLSPNPFLGGGGGGEDVYFLLAAAVHSTVEELYIGLSVTYIFE